MAEAAGAELVQHGFADVPERGMAEVVAQGDGLGQVLVQVQGAGDGAGDLAQFQGVGQARAVMVAFGRDEHLGLVLQAAERLGVQDAVAIALERRAHRRRFFRPLAAAVAAARGPRVQGIVFPGFQFGVDVFHGLLEQSGQQKESSLICSGQPQPQVASHSQSRHLSMAQSRRRRETRKSPW